MSDQLRDFARRHKQVQRKHRRLAQGYVTKLDRHGVIRHVPRRDYGGVLAMPLAILVLDGRPVLYLSERMKTQNEGFRLWKFRTMRETSKSDYESWMEGNEKERVTKFGSFLRRSHLDELPQIINVLKGDMSIVGPRPERPGRGGLAGRPL